MTKRVPATDSFNAEDGNPEDKRPRVHDPTDDNHRHQPASSSLSSSSSSHHRNMTSPSSLSSSFISNGNFYTGETNGNVIFGGGGGGNTGVLSDNGAVMSGVTNLKCSICLWPVGSSRCYHDLHDISHPPRH